MKKCIFFPKSLAYFLPIGHMQLHISEENSELTLLFSVRRLMKQLNSQLDPFNVSFSTPCCHLTACELERHATGFIWSSRHLTDTGERKTVTSKTYSPGMTPISGRVVGQATRTVTSHGCVVEVFGRRAASTKTMITTSKVT